MFLNTKARCLFNFVPIRALGADRFLADDTGLSGLVLAVYLLEISPYQPCPPALPASGRAGFPFHPHFWLHVYTADKIFHFPAASRGTCRLTGKGFV